MHPTCLCFECVAPVAGTNSRSFETLGGGTLLEKASCIGDTFPLCLALFCSLYCLVHNDANRPIPMHLPYHTD